MSNIIATIVVPSADGIGAGVDVSSMAALKTIAIGGTFTGNVFIEASLDGGNTYAPVGVVSPNSSRSVPITMTVVCTHIRARKSGTTIAGTPVILIAAEVYENLFVSPAVPATTGTGAASDVSLFGPQLTCTCVGDFDGVLIVEATQNDVDWVPIFRFSPGQTIQNFRGTFKSVRVSRLFVQSGTPVVTIGGSRIASANITSDDYWSILASDAGQAFPPNWDRWRIWGCKKPNTNFTQNAFPKDKIFVMPMIINRRCTVTQIQTVVQSGAGQPSRTLLGIYANLADAHLYPGNRLAVSAETLVDTTGSQIPLIWANPNLLLQPGNVYWLAHVCGDFNLQAVPQYTAADGPGLLGLGNSGSVFAGGTTYSLVTAFRIARTYDGTLPAVFPTAGAIDMFFNEAPAGQTTFPVYPCRLVAS